MQDNHSWELNEKVIRELWPKTDWGDENNQLRILFKNKLSLLNQVWLYESIQETKSTSPSWHPEINIIMKVYSRIESIKLTRHFGPTKTTDKWWVDYERPSRHTGLIYKFSTDAPDLKSATAIAASTGGRVRNHSQVIEQDSLVHFLKAQPRADIAAAVGALRARGIMSKDQLPSDISQWRTATVGFVTHQIQQAPKQKALA